MKKTLILFFLIFTFNNGFSCSCEPINPYLLVMDFNNTDYIFKGTVLRIGRKEVKGENYKEVTFLVSQDFKNNLKKEIVVLTPNEGPACGLDIYESGIEWVIWAGNYNSNLYTNQCTRSRQKINYSTDDLNLLQDLTSSSGYKSWKFPDNTLLAEGELSKSKPTGEWIYYDKGFISSEGNYNEGLRTGEWISYYAPNELIYNPRNKDFSKIHNNSVWQNFRKIKERVNFVKGKKEGSRLFYNYQGIIIRSFEYLDDKRDGICIFYENNITSRIDSYKNDELDGVSTFFHSNGIIELIAYHKRNVSVGEWLLFDNQGKLIKKDNCKNFYYDDKSQLWKVKN